MNEAEYSSMCVISVPPYPRLPPELGIRLASKALLSLLPGQVMKGFRLLEEPGEASKTERSIT